MTDNASQQTAEIIDVLTSQPVREKKPAGKNGRGKAPDESKRQKFVRLVDARMNRALEAIRRIGNLGGRNASHYEYDEDDVGKIVQALSKEIVTLEKTLIRGKPEAPAFSIVD